MKYKILISIIFLGVGAAAFAADGVPYNLLQPLPGLENVSGTNPFGDYIKGLIPFILSFAALLAVVMIVIGGIEYAVSEAVGKKEDAKDRITQAIYGLLLAMLSYLILWTINPALVNLQLNIPDILAPAGNTNTNGSLVGGPPGSTACIPGGGQCANCVLFPGTSQGICQPAGCNNPNGCGTAQTPPVIPPSASPCADWTTKSACTNAGCNWDNNNLNCGSTSAPPPTTTPPPTTAPPPTCSTSCPWWDVTCRACPQ